MKEYTTYIRSIKEDVLDREGEEIKLIIRDKDYIQIPVTAKIYTEWTEGLDKLRIMDPLGRPSLDDAAGIDIIRFEDEEKLVDTAFHKAGMKD